MVYPQFVCRMVRAVLVSPLRWLNLKFRLYKKMPKKLSVKELEFLKLTGNHLEFSRKLAALDCPNPDINGFAQQICEAWFRLGEQHLIEAKKMLSIGCDRATYSRAYYAAYNVSKGARYIANGFVSL